MQHDDADEAPRGWDEAGGAAGGGSRDPGRDPLDVGIAQFQQAALEAVQATRALLDAAEAVIREPAALEAVVGTVRAVARTASETVAGFAADAASRVGAEPPAGSSEPGAGDEPPEDGFERIRVD